MGDLRYIDAGVDIDAGNRAVKLIKEAVGSTHTPGVLTGLGPFSGSFELPAGYHQPVLVSSTDSVGTKVKVAIAAGRHRGIGIDLVNHCVNDIAVGGAEPLFFLDYFATGKLQPDLLAEIIDGAAEACREAGCALIGGETAEMPGVYALGDYDIAGFIVGAVEKARIPDPARVSAGDVLVGLPSNGLHTNGFSLVRHVFRDEKLDTPVAELGGRSLADELLAPHRSYLAALRLAHGAVDLLGAAHITGGGLGENVPRVLPDALGAEIDTSAWEVPAIFRLVESRGVRSDEMWRTFNMGMGMVLVVRAAEVGELLRALDGTGAVQVGRVVQHTGPERVRLA
ncbi:MAG: phosphoribosylformylglycinamidine cyclo-ligase [Chloroflexota bacterium]|jgi:phosphoribosylformylglycinamidine cyclo-ligase|nr:phosphoribosylformylglycinamidine cyclo-ligase [Chloroflexota bacterium]